MPPRLERVIEEREAAFWEQNGNPDSLSSVSQFHPDIQGQLPRVIDEDRRATALASWTAALEAVREGVPPEQEEPKDSGYTRIEGAMYAGAREFNRCRTAVTDHINSLGV